MEQERNIFGELGQVESLQERQRRWNLVTSPAMEMMRDSAHLGLRRHRAQFAGVFTRLVVRLESRGLQLTPGLLYAAAVLSYEWDSGNPAAALRGIAKHCHREALSLRCEDLSDIQGFEMLLEQVKVLEEKA